MTKTLLYDDIEFTAGMAGDLAEIHELPKEIVLQATAEFKETGGIDTERYDEKFQMGIESLAGMLSFSELRNIEEATEEQKNQALISTVSFVTDKMDDHFILDSDGIVSINPNNPPTLIKSYEVLRQTVALKDMAERMDDFGTWLLGSLVDELERFHGDEFDITDVMEQTEKSYNTVMTAVKVFRDFKGKRVKGLSFSHHKEVAFVKNLGMEDKLDILKLCKRKGYMSKIPRMIGNYVAKGGDLQEVKECATQEDVKDLVKEVNPETIKFLVYNQTWELVYGRDGEKIPGKIVIDTKHWTFSVYGSTPQKIERRLS